MSPYRPKPPEFVLDTDVVIAGAAGFSGRPSSSSFAPVPLEARILERWLVGQWQWVTSEDLLQEHEDILIIRGAPAARVSKVLDLIRRNARIVIPKLVVDPISDPKDAHVIGTVRAAGVPLVTRNAKDYSSLPQVLAPQEMVDEIEVYLRHPMVKIQRLLRPRMK